jgi:hypothetical protein
MRYFYVFDADHFHGRLAPALAASWRDRSFKSILMLNNKLHIESSRHFRRELWRVLVGELLVTDAQELPELETPLDSLARLVGQQLAASRPDFSPIQQAILGRHDLCFAGGYYRPEHAGWNDVLEVCRLAKWLASINPTSWSTANLAGSTTEDREDELVFAREWFPELVEMYLRADQERCVIVSEWA